MRKSVNKKLYSKLDIPMVYRLRCEGLVWLIGAVVYVSGCIAGPLVRYRRQWMAAYLAVVPLAHANQLPFPTL